MEFTGERIKANIGGALSYGELRLIKQALEFGGVCLVPSDTCYSLAALPFNYDVVEKISNIVPSTIKNPIPLSFGSLEMVEEYCTLSSEEYHTIDKFCPGPLTLTCKLKSSKVPNKVAEQFLHTSELLGVRIPDSQIERQISNYSKSPITTCAIRDDNGNIIQKYDDLVDIIKERVKKFEKKFTIVAIEVPLFNYKDNSTVVAVSRHIVGEPYKIKVFREGIINPKSIEYNSRRISYWDVEDWT